MILASGDGLFSVGRPVCESRNSVWTRSKRHYPSPTKKFNEFLLSADDRKYLNSKW